jgi:hypothetical protein
VTAHAPRFGGVAAILMLVVFAAPSGALAARHGGPTARIARATRLVRSIGRRHFAHGARRVVLRDARALRRAARHKPRCRTLAAADALSSALLLPTHWRHGRVPHRLVRRPVRLLATAGNVLRRRAGPKCARRASKHRLRPHRGGSGAPAVPPPSEEPDQGDGLNKPLPHGRLIIPKSVGAPSGLGPDPHGGAAAFSGRPFAHTAADLLSFFRNSDVGVPVNGGSPQEPTTAIDPESGVGWFTGNTSVGLSTDNGRTWQSFSPNKVLPDQGLAFCCDQLVSWSPQYHMFVWVSQYWCNKSCLVPNPDNEKQQICRTDGVFNRVRIAVASPGDLRANASNPGAAWTYWDVTGSTIGQPGNAWFDRSDMSVNPWNFNWGVDIICGKGGNLLARISLAQLAARGTATLSYIVDSGVRTTAQGLGTTITYFVGSNSDSQARIWSWEPFSGTLFRHDVDHSTVPTYDNAIKGSDGGNWYDRYGIFPGEVESATVSGNTLYAAQGTGRFRCTANCSSDGRTLEKAFDEPAILITKFDVNTWNRVGERWLWNSTQAAGWPALATDGAGDVGIAFRSSPENHNARPVAGFLTPSEQFVYAEPEGLPFETGDYYSLRPGRTPQSFAMTGEVRQNDPSGAANHWFYIEYGLGTPPYVAPPSVHITAPANLASVGAGDPVTYSADVSDPIDGTLPAAAIQWTEDGSFIGSGPSITHAEGAVGTHVFKVTATNGDGKSASDSVTVRVKAPPSDIAVSITSPADRSVFGPGVFNSGNGEYCFDVSFTATASGGSGPLSYGWDDIRTYDNTAPVDEGIVSTQLSPTLNLCAGPNLNDRSTHDLTLTVRDGTHQQDAEIEVVVLAPELR